MFGADEPNYATMPNGRKLLGELGALKPQDVFFRAHNLLCSGDGTPALKWGSTGAYSEDAQGKAVYRWNILDAIFDTYIASQVRPYAQIGFMPEALSTHPQPYQHHWKPGDTYGTIVTGWAYPPRDYDKWRELVYQWVRHCVARYGKAEVEAWYWEVWNEANGSYWKAKPEEFHKLHDYAVDGVRRALPTARVGGPDTAGPGGQWMRDFIAHCLHGTNYATGKVGNPLDFVSFHAKGSPTFTNGHVRLGIANQLRAIDSGFVSGVARNPVGHWGIGPRWLRGLSGRAAWLPQHNDVFELHGGELRAQMGTGAPPRCEPRRSADLGVHVRRPAAVCGFPPARQRGD
jgi:xylan 1,4-beta-xylosidase